MHLGHQVAQIQKNRHECRLVWPSEPFWDQLKTLPLKQCCLCARDRNRTCDLRVTSALLYRLSYTGGGLKLAPHPASGNSRPSAGDNTLRPETRLQVAAQGVEVLSLGLLDMGHIAQRDRYQQCNGQRAQQLPCAPGQRP